MKNKRGWIRIVEAFTMILLITGIFLVILDKVPPGDFSQEIYKKEKEILMAIQLNDTLRESVLNSDLDSLPIELENFPENLKTEINSRIPSNLECDSKICQLSDICILSDSIGKDTYAQETIIISTLETYSPRKLKLFCWEK